MCLQCVYRCINDEALFTHAVLFALRFFSDFFFPKNIHTGHADDMWASVTNFLHLEPIYDMTAPKTQDDLIRLRVMGIVVALLSTFHDGSTILFALLAGQHIGTSIALFISKYSSSNSFEMFAVLLFGKLACLRDLHLCVFFASHTLTDSSFCNRCVIFEFRYILPIVATNQPNSTNFHATIYAHADHDYLFFLIATLMAIKCNGFKGDDKESTVSRNAGWIHALRGQIVVVYFFASLWKLDSDWLSGQICKGIFMTFEEQGVSRGVPWKQIYSRFPGVFRFVGLSGLALDFSLFCVMAFLPPGHFLHSITFIFHGFTGYTMSQRIGYSFPIAMILTGLLFMRQDCIHEDQQSVGGDNLSHYQWLQWQLGLGKNNKKQQKEEGSRQRRRNLGPLLFLLVQWLIPLRMPLVSNGEFKQTFEGYRWSWTMMLHMKKSMQSPGLFFMTLTPDCEGMPPFPNPFAQQNIFLDVHSVSYEPLVAQKARTAALLQMFPRQMTRVAHSVNKNILGPQSCQGKPLSIRASYFCMYTDRTDLGVMMVMIMKFSNKLRYFVLNISCFSCFQFSNHKITLHKLLL